MDEIDCPAWYNVEYVPDQLHRPQRGTEREHVLSRRQGHLPLAGWCGLPAAVPDTWTQKSWQLVHFAAAIIHKC